MANGTVNPRLDQSSLSIDAIPDLRKELNDLRSLCSDSLKEALKAFMDSYASTLHDDLASRAELDEVKTQLNEIISVVETWDTENEDSTLEKLIKDVVELQARVSTLPELLTAITAFNESNFTAAKAVETMTTELADLKAKLEELSSSGSETGDQLTDIDARLTTAEADILNLKGADTEQASVLTQLTQAASRYLPGTDTKGELLETIEAADAKIPTFLEINKKSPVWEEVEGGEPLNTNDYLDYTLAFKGKSGEEPIISADLLITKDLNTYLQQAFTQLITGSTITSFNSRLGYVEGRLSNLTQYVAKMASYHNFIIKNIYFYFADAAADENNPNALVYLDLPIDPTPDDDLDNIQAEFVNVIPNFPDSARIDNKIFSAEELSGRNFYVVFETSFPIDLGDGKVELGFPDFDRDTNIRTAPSSFKCARLGIPDLSLATYVLYAGEDEITKKLIPFTFGSGSHVFGTHFKEEGTYKFMLKVTDPYNPNTTAVATKEITVGLPIYYGVYDADTLTSQGLADSFSILHTKFNSPATTIDWTAYNDLEASAKYYYYVVPTDLLANSTLVFNTGYGPGGWETQDSQIKINNIDYTVFRTSYKITYCPSTMVTVKSV